MTLPKNHRLSLIAEFGGKCQQCGYSRSLRALHFHHLDSSFKKEWSGERGNASLQEVRAHPERFTLLCANCHIELHDALAQSRYIFKPCDYCGKEFRIRPSQKEYERGKFCSRSCQHEARKAYTLTQENIERRIWKMVRKSDTCWEWTGSMIHGTPTIQLTTEKGIVTRSAIRLVFAAFHGYPLLPTQKLMRKCQNPRCVRPDPEHLILKKS